MKEQYNINIRHKCKVLVALYVIVMAVFYLVAGEQLHYKSQEITNDQIQSVVGSISNGVTVTQSFYSNMDEVDSIKVYIVTSHRINEGQLTAQLIDKATQKVLFEKTIDVSAFQDDRKMDLLNGDHVIGVKGKQLVLQFTSDSPEDKSVTLYTSSTAADESQELRVNGNLIPGALTMDITGRTFVPFTRNFLIFFFAFLGVLILYCAVLVYKDRTEKKSITLNVIRAFYQYRFLLQQLVSRDFKTKYKRSILGILWSFLNPLLTMVVQYAIFSTIFKQNIENFPAYLIIGVVFFNFFIESSTMGLTSIVENSQLITKVYIPKYIFPISRVLSACVNMLLSFVPMFAIIYLTGTPIRPALLLLPFPIMCIILFSLGISLFLSASMVFFRDMQFIWSVVSMLWMYITPIFYPESIIPSQLKFVLNINPLYHFIRFSRMVMLDGISPDPQAYFICFICTVVPLVIGAALFKKTQDKFILYI